MTILDDTPAAGAAHDTGEVAEPLRQRALLDRPWVGALIAGASAAAIGLLAVLAVVGIVGSLAPKASSYWGDLFGAGAAFWLVMGGSRLAADGVFIALTPLLATAGLVWLAVRGARQGIPESGSRRYPYAAFLGGYAALALLAFVISLGGPARPVWWSVPLPALGIPLLALALHEVPRGRWEGVVRHMPRTLRRAVRPALRTTVVMLLTGMGLVLLAVTLRLGEIARLYAELGAGLLGGLALTFAQVLAWPNLGLWMTSFLAGPGFTITEGSSVGLGGADGGVLPLIPVLGALPGKGEFGWYVALLYLVPVVIGGYAARRALAEIPRLASARTKLASVAATVCLAAAFTALLDGLAGGSLGDGRLASLGPSAGALFVSLCIALGLGAFVVTARDWWRLRR